MSKSITSSVLLGSLILLAIFLPGCSDEPTPLPVAKVLPSGTATPTPTAVPTPTPTATLTPAPTTVAVAPAVASIMSRRQPLMTGQGMYKRCGSYALDAFQHVGLNSRI